MSAAGSLVTNAPSGVVTEADLGARYTEPSVVERGDPLMRNGGLRHRQWNEARADGTVQAILDSILGLGIDPISTHRLRGSSTAPPSSRLTK